MGLTTHPNPSNSNGLNMPIDFDVSTYDEINLIASKQTNIAYWKHFAGGWSGVAVRFLSAYESGETYTQLHIEFGESLSFYQLYIQSRELFNFFVSGASCLECYFYSLYALGALRDPINFSMSPSDLANVKLKRVKDLYIKHFPCQLSQELLKLSNNSDYTKWIKIRNILVHRVLPGRMVYLSTNPNNSRSSEWKLDEHAQNPVTLDTHLTATHYYWLSNTINSLLHETKIFVDVSFP